MQEISFIEVSGDTYTSGRLNKHYEAACERLGYRPVFGVLHRGDRAVVRTTEPDVAREIIQAAEAE